MNIAGVQLHLHHPQFVLITAALRRGEGAAELISCSGWLGGFRELFLESTEYISNLDLCLLKDSCAPV